MLRVGIYVAEDPDRALSEPRESTMSFYGRVREGLLQTAGAFGGELRAQRAQRAQNLTTLSYESALRDRLVYGTPDAVVKRLRELRDDLGLSGVLMEPNVGGLIGPDCLEHSIRLFGQEVAPQLRS
jgi:alkanesulfonate monooxygenase SsuD/methylene tetrahydromethanopterin reductase-like flavin-dependent oxidoreductase (luciferase family)